jgi:hypothetical protein
MMHYMHQVMQATARPRMVHSCVPGNWSRLVGSPLLLPSTPFGSGDPPPRGVERQCPSGSWIL